MNGSIWPRGQGGIKRYNGTRWALLAAVAVAGAVAVAACGSVPAPGSAPASGHDATAGTHEAPSGAAQPALCRDTSALTSLVVTRNHGYKVPELLPAFPSQVAVTNPALIQAVARALCALPDMPPGVYNCPALLLGTAYTLRFAAGDRSLPLVTVNSTGCETVTGVGPVRRVSSPGFWRMLSRVLGVKTPPVYGGDVPGAPCQPPSTGTTKINGCPGVARPGTGVVAPAGSAAS
jgi:hypothetical protein